jgi:hypothetical protein
MEKVIELCKKYDISYKYYDMECHATGIGDILLRLSYMNNKMINEPFYINLMYFTKNYYNAEPINQLEFRFKLIKDILKYNNNINPNDIQFIFSNNYEINQNIPYHLIKNFNLNINDVIDDNILEDTTSENEYIVFHTKCRHTIHENYEFLKEQISLFCKNNKFKYKVIIIGERIFSHTEEVDIHGITTVYNELLGLKNNNNDIIDNSIENIYNNLDYDNYKNDIKLIKNAKYNVCFGMGGQFCTSTVFGKSTIIYCKVNTNLNTPAFNKNNFYCQNIDNFLNLIREHCCVI